VRGHPGLELNSDAEAGKTGDLAANAVKHLGNRRLGVLGICLFQQDVLLEETGEPTFHNLRQRLFGFAFVNRGFLSDPTLVSDSFSWYVFAGQVSREYAAMCIAMSRATSAPAASEATKTPTCGGRSMLVLCM
jgi:hypothetical protein